MNFVSKHVRLQKRIASAIGSYYPDFVLMHIHLMPPYMTVQLVA